MASSSKSPYGGGGAGGKFRNKPFRRQATPYERPPAAIRSPIQAAKNVFVSKFVDPASKIIANSAYSLFSSLFRKRLTAPPLVPEPTRETRDDVQQISTPNPGSRAQERLSNEHDNRDRGLGNSEIKEIEEVLNQRTFTKVEIDHLMELLRSRTVTVLSENDKKMPDMTKSHMEATHDFQEYKDSPVQGNLMESQRLLVGTSVGAGKSRVHESDVASAAELAKAYMDSVPLNASPTNLGSHSQAYRKDMPLLTNAPYTPKSNGLSFPVRFPAGVSDNGYTTPRSRGRSAIYNMARTPNSTVHDTAIRKIDSYEYNALSGDRQALKRRSSILNSDIGSIGPIRRVRQKTNMMSPPKNSSLPTSRNPVSISGNGVSSDIARGSRVGMQKQMFLNGPKGNTSNMYLAENDDNSAPNSFSVPTRSSEMAAKILQELDTLVPSPKEKLSELKLAVAREKSPTKLTHNMLHGKALRSLDNIDSSKLLKEDTFDSPDGSQLCEGRASTSHKKDETMLIAASNYKSSPKENGFNTNALKENVPSSNTSNSAMSNFSGHPTQKKRAFRMSAHEDFLDLDDDSDNGEVDLATAKEKLDEAAVDTKAITAGDETSENHFVPSSENKSPTNSIMKEQADEKVNGVSTNAEKDGNFTFPLILASSTNTQLTSPTSQAPVFSNGAATPKEVATAPTPSFGLKNSEEVGPIKFSSKTPAFNGSSDKTYDTQADPKLTQSSTATVDVIASVTNTPKVSKPDEGDNSQKSRDLFGHLQNVPSVASTSAATSLLSFGSSSNNPKANEGPFSVSSSLPISSTQVSNGSSNAIFSSATITSTTVAPTNTSSSTSTTISTPTTTTTTTTKSTPLIAEATTTVAPSVFKFGSNSVTAPVNSSSFPTSTTGIQSTRSEEKDKAAPSFGSLNGSPFGVSSSSSSFTTTGSGIFGFSASTASSTSNLSLSSSNQSSSSSPFGTSVGSLVGAQGTSAETKTETAPFTQSLPNQFGFSASSSAFGQSASSSLGSGSSLFGSSSNPFGSNSSSGFGLSSSTSLGTSSFSSGFGLSSSTSMGASSFSSGSGTSLFGSSLLSSTSSNFSSGFGSATSTSGFSFGASSAPAASASMVFGSPLGGSSSAPVFSFVSAAATTSAPLPSSPSVFGNPCSQPQFGSNPHSNDQVNMEDSMAEDTVQVSNSVIPAFGQQVNSTPPSNFVFGSSAPPGGSPFQFGGQQNLGTQQNQSPFQAGGNLEFSAGSSFSLGTGGGDKANRKIVRVKRDKSRKR